MKLSREKILAIFGRGNLILGVGLPLKVAYNVYSAVIEAHGRYEPISIGFLLGFGILWGAVVGSSGWGLLHRRPWALGATACAGGSMIGYSVVGIVATAIFIVDRPSSIDWDWILALFQKHAVLEVPLFLWWAACLGCVLKQKAPDIAEGYRDEKITSRAVVGVFLLFGAIVRLCQLAP